MAKTTLGRAIKGRLTAKGAEREFGKVLKQLVRKPRGAK